VENISNVLFIKNKTTKSKITMTKAKLKTVVSAAAAIFLAMAIVSCSQNPSRSRNPEPVFTGFSEPRADKEEITACEEQQVSEKENIEPRAASAERRIRNEQQEIDSDSVHVFVDRMPEFQGGRQGMSDFLAANNLNLTVEETNNRVIMTNFIIEIDGSVSDISVSGQVVEVVGNLWRLTELIDISESVKEDVIRIMQSMPKWTPAQHNGRAVRVRFNLPFPFHLE
jgi:hypothetical protein